MSLAGLTQSACTDQAPDREFQGMIEARLIIEVTDVGAQPIVGANVRVIHPIREGVELTYDGLTDSEGRFALTSVLTIPFPEWSPVTIEVVPPAGSGLASTVRADSIRHRVPPVASHSVAIVVEPSSSAAVRSSP
jgi:hypothetical protein